MEEQQSIFDTSFDNNLYIRRRQLLPLAAKIYVWFFIVLGCIFLLGGLFSLFNFLMGVAGPLSEPDNLAYLISRLFSSVMGGMLFLLVGLSIWKEAKWAIRFNWAIAVLVLVLLLFNIFDFSTGVITDDFTVFIPTLLFLPYWVMLYRIQRRWEQIVSAKNR